MRTIVTVTILAALCSLARSQTLIDCKQITRYPDGTIGIASAITVNGGELENMRFPRGVLKIGDADPVDVIEKACPGNR
jgi:hypothetical protein